MSGYYLIWEYPISFSDSASSGGLGSVDPAKAYRSLCDLSFERSDCLDCYRDARTGSHTVSVNRNQSNGVMTRGEVVDA